MKKNVFISIDLKIRDKKYLVQTFNIYPVSIKFYLKSETKIKSIIKNAINKLYIGDSSIEEFDYDKTKKYDDLSFSVYYEMKEKIKLNGEEKEIENFKKHLKQNYVVLKIDENLFVEKKLIGKCQTCVFNKEDCPFRKGKNGIKRICKDYVEG